MKRLITLILFLILLSSTAWAAGSCTQSQVNYPAAKERWVVWSCTGDASNGSIPSTAIAGNTSTSTANTAFLKGYKLYEVVAYPTSGGTAPDAASVFLIMNGVDLLGSEDGGTTAYQGLNLIHATLKRVAFPDAYVPRAGAHVWYQPLITDAVQLKVIDQSTASADYTVVAKAYTD